MEELAIIKNVGFGMRDMNKPVLWFTVETLYYNSLLFFTGNDILDFIKKANVYDCKDINGRTCIVETNEGTLKFLRFK